MAGDVCCTLVSSTRYCDLFGREKGSSETVKVQVTVSEAALALSFIRRRSRGSVPTLARIEIYGEPRAAGNMETEASARSEVIIVVAYREAKRAAFPWPRECRSFRVS